MLATVMRGGQALLDARLVAMPGSTRGLFVKNEVLPKLAIADKESRSGRTIYDFAASSRKSAPFQSQPAE
jgi:hypothetical protein